MNRKLFLSIILIFSFAFLVLNTSSVGRFFRIRGDFLPDNTWNGGHPGRVLFDIGTSNSGYYAGIDVDGKLSGYFWLGNVGWSTFSHGDTTLPVARVMCPNNVFNDLSVTCPVDGFVWSQNSGWISLSGTWIGSSSGGVYYNPAESRLEGFAHSTALGWIPFYADTTTPIVSATQSGVLFNGVGLNFIGKIAIIGNIAGTRIYNIANQQVGYIFSIMSQAEMLNIIRKNIALITRNANPSDLTDQYSTKFDFLIHTGSDYDTSVGGWTWPAGKKSIIVMGNDVILGQTQIGLDTDSNHAIIALKDSNGSGGNIIIKDLVGRIYSFLYAEGSIYSGEKVGSQIIPYVGSGVWNIPGNQLYIKGSMISKNTIGGSLQSPPVCPVVIQNCSVADAQVYDFDYFRTYDSADITQKNVPYNDSRFSNASVVIEFNQELNSKPPPGLQSIFQ
ncbi:MAG: hypothetical protein HHAS10_06680 [Candidatus Altimarinota bacterium]